MTQSQTDGKGPRWIGDALPDLPAALQYAQDLPPKITDAYVLFFGFAGPEPECCLQQWYPSVFHSGGDEFHTAEQYMMWRKAQLMGDSATAGRILRAATPAQAKQLGREVQGFKQTVWDAHCDAVVEEGNWLKVSQNEGLRKVLLGPGRRGLVETSPNHRLWGVGFNSDEAVGNEERWGENKLGKALERVRARLWEED
jgi:ribA/ribD-fused uncharacterized protein